jgi:hypothetical protein
MSRSDWDGYVRTVVSIRHGQSLSNGRGKPVRIERLSCQHEQAFTTDRSGGAALMHPRQFRVCSTCRDLGRREVHV